MLHEERIGLNPVAVRQPPAQLNFGLVRGHGPYQPPAIGDAVNMGIDADRRLVKGKGTDQIGGLPPDARQTAESIDIGWYDAAITIQDKLGNSNQAPRRDDATASVSSRHGAF